MRSTSPEGRVGNVGIADTSRSFNTDLLAALELANMLDIGECILQSGLQREESRGAHQRTDFPERDDGRSSSTSWCTAAPTATRGSSTCR